MPPIRHNSHERTASPYVRTHQHGYTNPRQAPHSACQACRLAKQRCAKLPHQNTCLRCQGLALSCQHQTSIERTEDAQSTTTDSGPVLQSSRTDGSTRYGTTSTQPGIPPQYPTQDCSDILLDIGIDLLLAAQCFEVYINEVMPVLPIVAFAEGVDVQVFRTRSPLLFAAVVCIGALVKGLGRIDEAMTRIAQCVMRVEHNAMGIPVLERIQTSQILAIYNKLPVTVVMGFLRHPAAKDLTCEDMIHCRLVYDYLLALYDLKPDILVAMSDAREWTSNQYRNQLILLIRLQQIVQQASKRFQADNSFDSIKQELDDLLKCSVLVTSAMTTQFMLHIIAQTKATMLLQALSALKVEERAWGIDRFREETQMALQTLRKVDDKVMRMLPMQLLHCLCDLLTMAFGEGSMLDTKVLNDVRLVIHRMTTNIGHGFLQHVLCGWVVLEELLSWMPPLRTWSSQEDKLISARM